MRLAGLYAITPDSADSDALIGRARAALEFAHLGGWAALQYRNKAAGARSPAPQRADPIR